ncbi:MAG: beta-ketoacyl-ACP synthase II [Chloroflexota bacterium]|nr:beta-ketoacyl-ACP synthase II [Chloroflexota bacterium]
MHDRVVITGYGAVTPLADNADDTWRAVLSGESGIGRITAFDPAAFTSQIAGEVTPWDPKAKLGSKHARRTDRFTQFALEASRAALEHSGLEITDANRHRVGVYIGTGIGGLVFLQNQTDVLRERGPSRISPFLIPLIIGNMAAGMVSMEYGIEGPNLAVVSACATGAHSIGEAAEVIRRGEADAMLAGGTEGAISPIGLAGFCAGRALSTRNDEPERASRPFDRERDGFVAAEGAGVVILESYAHAEARGAEICGELLGYGASADAFHMTQPPADGRGARLAMENALRNARLDSSDIDYVNAHGTATEQGDSAETQALKGVFSNGAMDVPISSTKSMMGHLIGAAGSVELILCLQALRDNVAPPTINYEIPDPDCDLDYVPNQARELPLRRVMSNSFGFGGQNAALIVGSDDS